MRMRLFGIGLVLLGGSALLASNPTSVVAGSKYTVDPIHSSAVFKITHLNVSNFYGRFNEVTGRFTFDEKSGALGDLEIRIKTESIDTNGEARDRHLKSAEFFDVANHPFFTFKATNIKKKGKNRYAVRGDLTLKGETKSIQVKTAHTGNADCGPRFKYRAGFETVFTIKRSDFGVSALPEFLGDDVEMTISVEAVREEKEKKKKEGGW